MTDFQIVAYDKLSRSPAALLATKGWVENVESGTGEDTVNVSWDHQALVAFADSVAVGVITWASIEWRREVFVHQAYVLPPWRRRGVYTQLWHALVAKAVELKVPKISLMTHVDNKVMLKVCAKIGLTGEAISMSLDVSAPP